MGKCKILYQFLFGTWPFCQTFHLCWIDFDRVASQCSIFVRRSCKSLSEFWKIYTDLERMCYKLQVLTKNCWYRSEGPDLVSDTELWPKLFFIFRNCSFFWLMYYCNGLLLSLVFRFSSLRGAVVTFWCKVIFLHILLCVELLLYLMHMHLELDVGGGWGWYLSCWPF